MSITVMDGIIIGAVGGAVAGISIWMADLIHKKIIEYFHKKQVYEWLYKVTKPNYANAWRSTRAIASHNNLTQDRVRYLCSIHKKIIESTGQEEDLWGIKEITRDTTNKKIVA